MIEIFVIIACVTIALAAYMRGQLAGKSIIIANLQERVTTLTADNKELQAKLLLKNGIAPLPKPREPRPDREMYVTPQVVMRSQMAARADGIGHEKPSYPQVSQDVIEKAKKIITE